MNGGKPTYHHTLVECMYATFSAYHHRTSGCTVWRLSRCCRCHRWGSAWCYRPGYDNQGVDNSYHHIWVWVYRKFFCWPTKKTTMWENEITLHHTNTLHHQLPIAPLHYIINYQSHHLLHHQLPITFEDVRHMIIALRTAKILHLKLSNSSHKLYIFIFLMHPFHTFP